jgi:hypothetical protein
MTDAARRGRAGSPAGRDLVWFRHADGSGPLAYPEHLGEIGGMARRAAENLASDLPSEAEVVSSNLCWVRQFSIT